MLLIGAGQGLAFGPLTDLALTGVAPEDAGAASGVLNTFHQLGMALGLALLVSISAPVGGTGTDGTAAQVQTALVGASALLALALAVTVASVARPARGVRG